MSRRRRHCGGWNCTPESVRTDLEWSAFWLQAAARAIFFCFSIASAQAPTDADESRWVREASADLDSRAGEALGRIADPERQLLALRAYLRAGSELPQMWSWSQQQLDLYPSTPEGQSAAADIQAVEDEFARANPGYYARANRMPRSLETQLTHWNENPAVAAVASQLVASLQRQFPTQAGLEDVEQLRQALVAWKPSIAAPLAAPGLSAHGQGRAFDFQIEHGSQIVAGFQQSQAEQRWDAHGWTRKLHAAVMASGKAFSGPLQSPYEPWHYAYKPTR